MVANYFKNRSPIHYEAEYNVGTPVGDSITIDLRLIPPFPERGRDRQFNPRTSAFAYISDDPDGQGFVTPSGGITASTGTLVPSGSGWRIITDATGRASLAITEATADSLFLVLIMPNGEIQVSPELVFA